MADPYSALYGEDPQAAQDAAQALAQAMAKRRAAGTIGTVGGGPFAASGKQFSGEADQTADLLTRALQARANAKLQRERMDRYGPSEAAERFVPVPAGGYAVSTKSGQTVPIPKVDRPVLTKEPKPPKPPDPGKRSLGEYFTPATSDMTDTQRNQLMDTLAVPGAQWLDQMAQLNAKIETMGSTPSPQDLAEVQSLIAAALVKQNKVAGLGALSGPDMDLLKKAGGSVAELTNIFGQATGLRDLQKSIRSAAARGARDIKIAAGAFGATPVPGKALDFDTWEAQSAKHAENYKPKPAKAAPAAGAPVKVTTKEERDALPAGTKYVGPDGQTYTKR